MSDIEHTEDTIPFYPDHVRTEFYVVLGVLAIGEPADPLNTPLHVKPEWYFLALYQILKKIPPMVLGIEGKIIGVVIPIVLVALIFIWPFLDNNPDKSKRAILIRLAFAIFAVITIIALTIWGEVS
jgi:quinol-cytochrome oxidoreductase complex cytochrome b subunit